MKLWKRVIDRRLKTDISISKTQFGFIPGISTTEAIRLIRKLMKLYSDKDKDLHMVVIDLKKAYNRVFRMKCYGSIYRRKGRRKSMLESSEIYIRE